MYKCYNGETPFYNAMADWPVSVMKRGVATTVHVYESNQKVLYM